HANSIDINGDAILSNISYSLEYTKKPMTKPSAGMVTFLVSSPPMLRRR
ncbi:MAG: hypothetical protein ACI9NC_005414, partial [Verrucomicrobiales bacterium]